MTKPKKQLAGNGVVGGGGGWEGLALLFAFPGSVLVETGLGAQLDLFNMH